jgi:hypothetical protein
MFLHDSYAYLFILSYNFGNNFFILVSLCMTQEICFATQFWVKNHRFSLSTFLKFYFEYFPLCPSPKLFVLLCENGFENALLLVNM